MSCLQSSGRKKDFLSNIISVMLFFPLFARHHTQASAYLLWHASILVCPSRYHRIGFLSSKPNVQVYKPFQKNLQQQPFPSTATKCSARFSTSNDGYLTDDLGRRVRTRRLSETNNDLQKRSSLRRDYNRDKPKRDIDNTEQNNDGWGDTDDPRISWSEFDPLRSRTTGGHRKPKSESQKNTNSRGGSGRDYKRPTSGENYKQPRSSKYGNRPPSNRRDDFNRKGESTDSKEDVVRINMNALESAGFVHLYGLSSVLNALTANKRRFPSIDKDNWIGVDDDNFNQQHQQQQQIQEIKPEAQFTSWLFVQSKKSGITGSTRASDKSQQAQKVLEMAKERSIPVATVDKGVLNTLSGNRPHQGYVLRCGSYEFEPISRIPKTDNIKDVLWLVLDEVVDPQNLGALIRSAYFLGNVNVLVCAKNSAPPSATVSAASAGALELTVVYSTSNLSRTLEQAEEDGFRIIGASADGEENSDIPMYDLPNLPVNVETQPTILVLGSEGRGLRHIVAKACTEFVRIPSGRGSSEIGVDSLNVSVTGAILLWHLLQRM